MYELSSDIVRKLDEATDAVERREVAGARVVPIVLRRRLTDLIRRRKQLFHEWKERRTPYGMDVWFSRRLRPSAKTPKGRLVTGEFALLEVAADLALIVSTLNSDAYTNGLKHLLRRVYPLATRPFVSSSTLADLISDMAAGRGWRDVSVAAIGYCRETRAFRHEMQRQPVRDAALEMAQQSRDLHRATISFRDSQGRERLRCAFDRYGAASLRQGSLHTMVEELVLPLVAAFCAKSHEFDVAIAAETPEQKSVLLVYPEGTLTESEELEAVCGSIRTGDGLGVSVIHLNPYLHAQVLDYFTGAAVDLTVVDGRSIALVPRTSNSGPAIERITATIFRFFGEGRIRVAELAALKGGHDPGD